MKSCIKLSPISLALFSVFSTQTFAEETNAEALAPIVVTAAGTSQDLKDAPASISIVNKEQLKQHPSNRLEEALQDIPGVNVSGSNVNKSDISIRGLPADYTLIWLMVVVKIPVKPAQMVTAVLKVHLSRR